MKPPRPSPQTCRFAFAAFALALATATHWPGLAVESPYVPRLDLLIHATVFATWTTLLVGSRFFGPGMSRRNIWRSCLVALAYAAVDELTQGIPAVHRTVDPLDLAANGTGIVLTCVFLAWRAGRIEAQSHAR